MLSELWFEFFGSQELCLMIFAVPVQFRVFHDPTIQSLSVLLAAAPRLPCALWDCLLQQGKRRGWKYLRKS